MFLYDRFMTNALLVIVPLLLFPFTVHAYLNPEAGSALYQVLIGSLLAVGALWRFLGRWVRDVLKKFR